MIEMTEAIAKRDNVLDPDNAMRPMMRKVHACGA